MRGKGGSKAATLRHSYTSHHVLAADRRGLQQGPVECPQLGNRLWQNPSEVATTQGTLRRGSVRARCSLFQLQLPTSEYKVWRYQHFHSHTPYAQKRALLTARLRKVQQMASDPDMLYQSGLAKVREFQAIRYPIPMLRAACNYLAASTGEHTWLNVRDTL